MLCDASDAQSTSSLGQMSNSASVAPPVTSLSSVVSAPSAVTGMANGSLTDAAAAAAVSHNTDLTSMLCDEVRKSGCLKLISSALPVYLSRECLNEDTNLKWVTECGGVFYHKELPYLITLIIIYY